MYFSFFTLLNFFGYLSMLECETAEKKFDSFSEIVRGFPEKCLSDFSGMSIRVFHPLPK
jgi:hypothetical protein